MSIRPNLHIYYIFRPFSPSMEWDWLCWRRSWKSLRQCVFIHRPCSQVEQKNIVIQFKCVYLNMNVILYNVKYEMYCVRPSFMNTENSCMENIVYESVVLSKSRAIVTALMRMWMQICRFIGWWEIFCDTAKSMTMPFEHCMLGKI